MVAGLDQEVLVMLKAQKSFVAGRRRVRRGDLVENNDPIVKGREKLFAAPEVKKAPAKKAPAKKAPAKKAPAKKAPAKKAPAKKAPAKKADPDQETTGIQDPDGALRPGS